MAAARATTDADRLDRRTVLALFAMALAIFLVANDFTALSVALPRMEHDLDADVSTVQWVINAYSLVFAILIVTGGRLADMLGRRRMFFVGAGIFAAFSALAGLAPDAGWLIAARALMGVGGALMWPAVLGMTYAALPARKAGLAGGLFMGVAGLGNAFGPLVGGALTDAASWRWVLLLNLPIAAIAILVTWREVHQPVERAPGERLDRAGVVALSLALVALLVALDQATDWGIGDWRTIGLLCAFVLSLGAFVAVERRAGALIPGDVMRTPAFRASCVAVPLLAAGFFSTLVYLPQFMQKLLGATPLQAGLGLLPLMLVFGLVSFAAGRLYARLGPKGITSIGAGCMVAGLVALTLVTVRSGYGSLVAGMVLFGVGVGLFVSSATTAGITALPGARASLGGGILYMLQLGGGAIGLALNTTIFTAVAQGTIHADRSAGVLNTGQEHAVNGILAGTDGASRVVHRFPNLAAHLETLARHAFVDGMRVGFAVMAALAAVGLVVAVTRIGGPLRFGRRPTAAAEPEAAAGA